MLNDTQIAKIITKKILVSELTDDELAEFCILANKKYRSGSPIIIDSDYDFIYLTELAKRNPKHSLLVRVESDNYTFSSNKLLLPEPMLSTDKAYSFSDIKKWFTRIEKSATEIKYPIKDIIIEITAKLDGFAAFDDGNKFYTRGDGKKGSDISYVFARGLGIFKDNKRGLGAGEIVVKKSYFKQNLADNFEYPRNFQASIIKEKSLDKLAAKAIKDKAALFVPFIVLPRWSGVIAELSANFINITNDILNSIDFDVDGVVLSVVNDKIKQSMGSNRKFHRYQIAFKENKDKAQVQVLDITAQVGRTGKITPVAELEPTLLSGATLSRASAYHYGYIRDNNLGKKSIVELTRSGMVIPKINKILKATKAVIPIFCPSCGEKLVWNADFLCCMNYTNCREQKILSLLFFFATLGNNDGFGRATIEKIYDYGIDSIIDIYTLNINNLSAIGFGDKTRVNLFNELQKSRIVAIEDWRFLASFGINRLGLGNCERLLKNYKITDIFNLSTADITSIEGFAKLTADVVITGILNVRQEFEKLLSLPKNNICPVGFNLELTKTAQNNNIKHFFSKTSIVFSGKMQQSRANMTKTAKLLSIKVLNSVTSKCDYLIIGENVGQSKLKNAKKHNVKIMTETDYLAKIKNTL